MAGSDSCLAVALHGERDGGAGGGGGKGGAELVGGGDGGAIDGEHDVVRLQARGGGGRVGGTL